jgi:hypothetical protein
VYWRHQGVLVARSTSLPVCALIGHLPAPGRDPFLTVDFSLQRQYRPPILPGVLGKLLKIWVRLHV